MKAVFGETRTDKLNLFVKDTTFPHTILQIPRKKTIFANIKSITMSDEYLEKEDQHSDYKPVDAKKEGKEILFRYKICYI